MSNAVDRDRIARTVLRLAGARGPAASFCPSEVARALDDDWRPLMPAVRAVAAELADAGRIVVTRRGRRVDPRAVRGPIRLRLADDG